MTRDEAKRILAAWRPDAPEEATDDVREALAMVAGDAELAEWLQGTTDFHRAVRTALKDIPAPPDLADRILRANKEIRPSFGGVSGGGWIAIACLVLAVGFAAFWIARPRPTEQDDFSTFRGRMVRSVIREYRMDVVTNQMAAIRSFLASRAAPADFSLPPKLAAMSPTGGGLLSWQGQPVSMVCLDGGAMGTLFLFAVPSTSVRAGQSVAPELVQVNTLGTVGWTSGGTTFVLAASASPAALRDLL